MAREYCFAARDANPKRRTRPWWFHADRMTAARAMLAASPKADVATTERAFRDRPDQPWQPTGCDIQFIARSRAEREH